MRYPKLLGIGVLLAFLPWLVITAKSERQTRQAIVAHEPFSIPEFPFKFSRTMPYDSLGFMGLGRQAGFWTWTPAGFALEEKGRAYFAETAQEISAIVGAGRREVSSLQGVQDRDGRREVRFRYRWVEVSPPAATLLSRPPKPGVEYDGRAVLVKQDDGWRVELLETPDFDRPMVLLRDTALGAKR